MSDMIERLKKVVMAELGVSEDKIVMEASFRDDLGADSRKIFDLIMAVEDEFGIEVPDEDAVMIVTVGDAADYLKKRQV
ncbi:MAG TPA: acyl carrier protein [bacterium]|nr:MAG: Acyl carrier protein [bacterium ADurb.Bin236]HOC92088.1 acyl carrier protein [bacterium]HOY62278.1 acyl carrier protein [bacterium]HPI75561.1 acyl carrier protein [bacterium]HPN93473.1 acyl carrier protein [bacterium]